MNLMFAKNLAAALTLLFTTERLVADVVDVAAGNIGIEYEFGGNGPDSFDCSGLTKYAFEQVGIQLPRRAVEQSQSGQAVATFQRGDLLFFATDDTQPDVVTHVGIYEGGTTMIDANSVANAVKRDDFSINYWITRFLFARRVLTGQRVVQPGPDNGKDIWTTSTYSYATCSKPGPGGGLYDSELRVGGFGDFYYTLLEFDLTLLPTHATSVSLQLYCYSDNAGTPTPIYLDRITQSWWNWQTTGTGCDHDRLWWTDRPPAVQWSASALSAPVVGQWYNVDITDLYNAWQSGLYPNYGLELRPVQISNNFNFFYSSRYLADPTFRPKLVIQE